MKNSGFSLRDTDIRTASTHVSILSRIGAIASYSSISYSQSIFYALEKDTIAIKNTYIFQTRTSIRTLRHSLYRLLNIDIRIDSYALYTGCPSRTRYIFFETLSNV